VVKYEVRKAPNGRFWPSGRFWSSGRFCVSKSKIFDFFVVVPNGFLYGLGVVWGLYKWILDISGGFMSHLVKRGGFVGIAQVVDFGGQKSTTWAIPTNPPLFTK
jgi:hypothetical protein